MSKETIVNVPAVEEKIDGTLERKRVAEGVDEANKKAKTAPVWRDEKDSWVCFGDEVQHCTVY